jgi:hypothetical protein
MSTEAVNQSKEQLLQTIADLQRATKDAGGRLGNMEQAVDALTGKFRELRNLDTAAQEYRASGTEAEAFGRYAMDPDLVKGQTVDTSNRGEGLQYAGLDGNRQQGREYVVSKDARHAVRMLSEWDELGNVEPGLLDDPAPTTEWQHRLQQLAETRTLVRLYTARPDSRGGRRYGATPKVDRAIARHIERGPSWVKQVFADNSTEGGEFIPDVVLPELMRKLESPRNVMALFPTMSIPTGGTTTNPFLTVGCQPFIVGVPTSGDLDPADIERSVPTTTSITTSPKTWGVSLPASRDATEDSIVEWGGFGNMLLAEAIRDGEEDAAINADTNGGDTGLANWNPRSRWNTLGSSNDHRKSFIGLRHQSIDASASSALGTESAVGLMTELAGMDSPQFMDDVVFVTSPEWVLLKLITDTNLLTVDKYGSLATLLTGEVGRVFGKPVVMSEFVDVQYNASGVYDDTTKTKTGVLALNRRRWAKGVRRGPRVEVETRPAQHITVLVVTERWALRHLGRTTEKSVVWMYNATAS